MFKTFAMNLSVISEQIAIDKIETTNSKNFVHFLSRPDESFSLPQNWDSNVYMSRTTARAMLLKQSPIPMKFIHILESNKSTGITLPNGMSCTVTMFENSGLAESVAFHFKGNKCTALYSGSFTRCRALLLNNLLRGYVLNGIDFLFVDNTVVNSTDPVSQSIAASEIGKISNSYPDHRILMNVPPFGYEDLIYSVVNLAKLKVFAEGLHLLVFQKYNLNKLFESDVRESQLIVANQEVVTMETIYRRFTVEKLLTLRIIPCGSAPKNYFEKSGLFQVHWSPHPLLFEICYLVNYIKPKSVNGIHPSFNLPAHLRGSHQQDMESKEEMKFSPIKAKLTKNDDLQLDKSWSMFDSASEPESYPGSNQVKQSKGVTEQSTLKEQQACPSRQDVTIPCRRKRRRKSSKEYPQLPRRLKKQEGTDTLLKVNNLFNAEEKSDQSFNGKEIQSGKSLSISTFTSLSLFTNNDQALNVSKDANKQFDKIMQSVKSASVSTFTSLSSFEGNMIRQNKVSNLDNPDNEKRTQNSNSIKSQNKTEKENQIKSHQKEYTKSKLAQRLKTTSKKDPGSEQQKESEQNNTTSLSVVCSLTISTFSSLELESSSASSIIPIKKKKISTPTGDGYSQKRKKSVGEAGRPKNKKESLLKSIPRVTFFSERKIRLEEKYNNKDS